jgi:hypothetical protein
MFRVKMLVATAIASVVLAACSDTSTTAPRTQTNGPPSVAASPRNGALHLVRECSQYTGLANSFCTITSSNLAEIPVGSKVVFASAAGAYWLSSDFVLNSPGSASSSAVGHCDVNLTTDLGLCTFFGGTGNLTGFQASASVAYAGGNIWYGDGTYNFTR